MTGALIVAPSSALQAPALFTPTPKAAQRVLEFFTAQINNDHTRRAYLNATRRFAAWCGARAGGGAGRPGLIATRAGLRVWVATQPIDFRRGVHGLVALAPRRICPTRSNSAIAISFSGW